MVKDAVGQDVSRKHSGLKFACFQTDRLAGSQMIAEQLGAQ